MIECSCGRDLQFMGYHIRRGLHHPMIEVGCPSCDIHFFYAAKDREEVESFPCMNQIDWLKLRKSGFKLRVDAEVGESGRAVTPLV